MKKILMSLLLCSIVFSTMLISQGYSLQFNGVNNYVDCLSGGIGNNPSVITQEAWLKINTTADTDGGMVMSKRHADDGADWAVMQVYQGRLNTFPSDKSYSSGTTFSTTNIGDGKWHHAAVERNGDQYMVFVDGKLENTLTDTHVLGGSPYNLHIGHDGSFNAYFKGLIAEVRVWNRALSEAEIKSKMFSNLIPSQETGLVGYWKFNEGTGTIATDLAGTNNGTITGATWVSDRPSITNFGLVAYYPFNGNANDESGNANNGTVNGASLSTDRFGNANKAYDFNGSSNSITVPTLNNFQYLPVTYSAWIYFSDSYFTHSPGYKAKSIIGRDQNYNTVQGIFSFADDQNTNTNNIIIYHTGGSGMASTIKPLQYTWHHLVFTQDNNGKKKFYLDGVIRDSLISTIPQSANIAFRIGSGENRWYWKGKIDDIRLYNRVLDDTEIQPLYNEGGWTSLNQGLVTYYPFNGNANDSSGNSNNGTVNGATLITDRFGNANKAYSFNGTNNYIKASASNLPTSGMQIKRIILME